MSGSVVGSQREINIPTVNSAIKNSQKKLAFGNFGMPSFRLLSYPFRHYRQVCSVALDKAVVGHTQITTTQLYLKSTNKLKKEAVAAIAL